jgi:hypothetical protein
LERQQEEGTLQLQKKKSRQQALLKRKSRQQALLKRKSWQQALQKIHNHHDQQ